MSGTESEGNVSLSVVVIGRNEGERLRTCLASVQQMRCDEINVEVLYVDSGSTDGSVALAELMGVRSLTLQPSRPTAALARNAGWIAASGDIVLFLDGDTVLDPEFVVASLPMFADPKIAVVWGHRREAHPERSIYNRVLDLDWIYAPGPAPFCGGDALMRRSVLVATGGFDATLIAGEEPELCRRITAAGYLIEHTDHAMTNHDLGITRFAQYWRRSMRAGHAYAEVSERFKRTDSPFWQDDARRNRNRALLLSVAFIAALAISVVRMSLLPLMLFAICFAAVGMRTAWRARWKTCSRATLMLYGIHAQVQQVPIYVGQLQFRWSRRQHEATKLMEYKRP